jgi:hypothetical protein
MVVDLNNKDDIWRKDWMECTKYKMNRKYKRCATCFYIIPGDSPKCGSLLDKEIILIVNMNGGCKFRKGRKK